MDIQQDFKSLRESSFNLPDFWTAILILVIIFLMWSETAQKNKTRLSCLKRVYIMLKITHNNFTSLDSVYENDGDVIECSSLLIQM